MPPNAPLCKEDDDKEPLPGDLARRTADTALKGMQVKVDDSDKAWAEWQAAFGDKGQAPLDDTLPSPLIPDP